MKSGPLIKQVELLLVNYVNTSFMMKNTLTPTEMLDKALHWFAMDVTEMGMGEQLIAREQMHKDKALQLMVSHFPELNTSEFLIYSNLIIEKLKNDGHLTRTNNEYSITFDGKLFHQLGGYKRRNEIITNAERIKDSREKRLLYGTWAVAIGAIALVVWEVIKTFVIEKH